MTTSPMSKPGDPDYISVAEATRRQLAFNAEWEKRRAPNSDYSNALLAVLRREAMARDRMAARGEAEGPPNPYRPHRRG